MSQRKKEKAAEVTEKHENESFPEKPKGAKKTGEKNSILVTLLLAIFLTTAITAGVSYLVTDSLTFGVKLPNFRKYLPKREKVFTPEELLQYDGSDPNKPVYLAIMGKVYDVTAGRSTYGKGGGYSFFAGREGARAFTTGCFQTHLTHDLRGLSEDEIKSIQEWADFYEKSDKYFYVGKLLNPPIDPDSPIPAPCT